MAGDNEIYRVLRKSETVIFVTGSSGLRDFMSLYYKTEEFREGAGGADSLLYAVKASDLPLSFNPVFCWIAEPCDVRIPGKTVISGADLKEEYIKRFLGGCSA